MQNPPKIIYVTKNTAEPIASTLIPRLRQRLFPIRISGQDGFVRASLQNAFDCIECRAPDLERTLTAHPDTRIVFWNSRCYRRDNTFEPGWRKLRHLVSVPQVLVITAAQAAVMPDDELLSAFAAVIKREPYIDRGRYDISPANADKIFATTLGCNPLPVFSNNVKTIKPAEHGYPEPAEHCAHDVFFSGDSTRQERVDIIESLARQTRFSFSGGLREERIPVPDAIRYPRLSKQKFADMVRSGRINLALAGIGEFTFRHLELSYFCAFCLSDKEVLDQENPIPFRDGEHFVTFSDREDLLAKITHYLAHPGERDRIARNGRRLFEQHYDFKRHGRDIRTHVERLIGACS